MHVLSYYKFSIRLGLLRHICPTCVWTGVRCCCCSGMEIGTLAMSDAQGIAIDAMRQVGSYASRLQEVSVVGVVCKVVAAKLECCMFP